MVYRFYSIYYLKNMIHTYITFRMQLYQEFLSFEAEFSYFCPRKSIDFRTILEDKNTKVSNGQVERNSFMVLQNTNQRLVLEK